MKTAEISRELINILDQSITMMRQDLVTARNDMMITKIEIAKLSSTVDGIKAEMFDRATERRQEAKSRTAMMIGIGTSVIAAGASLAVGFLQYYKD